MLKRKVEFEANKILSKKRKTTIIDQLSKKYEFYYKLYKTAHKHVLKRGFTLENVIEKVRPIEIKFKMLEKCLNDRELFIQSQFDGNIWSNILGFIGDPIILNLLTRGTIVPPLEDQSIGVGLRVFIDKFRDEFGLRRRQFERFKLFNCEAVINNIKIFDHELLHFNKLSFIKLPINENIPTTFPGRSFIDCIHDNTVKRLTLYTKCFSGRTGAYELLDKIITSHCTSLLVYFVEGNTKLENSISEVISKSDKQIKNLRLYCPPENISFQIYGLELLTIVSTSKRGINLKRIYSPAIKRLALSYVNRDIIQDINNNFKKLEKLNVSESVFGELKFIKLRNIKKIVFPFSLNNLLKNSDINKIEEIWDFLSNNPQCYLKSDNYRLSWDSNNDNKISGVKLTVDILDISDYTRIFDKITEASFTFLELHTNKLSKGDLHRLVLLREGVYERIYNLQCPNPQIFKNNKN